MHFSLDGGDRLDDKRFWMGVHSGQPFGSVRKVARGSGRNVAHRPDPPSDCLPPLGRGRLLKHQVSPLFFQPLAPSLAQAFPIDTVAMKKKLCRVGNVPSAPSHQPGGAGKISPAVSREHSRANRILLESVRQLGLGSGVGCKHSPP